MEDDYKGLTVGIEIKLGLTPPTQLGTVLLLLEELRMRHPKEFKAAMLSIEAME